MRTLFNCRTFAAEIGNEITGIKFIGELLACFYIAGEQKVADWLAKTVMTRMGWFTPPFDTANDVRKRLEPYYDILDFHVEGAMLYFKAQKR